jgi:hypothetical protein
MANTRPSGLTIGSAGSPVTEEVIEIDGRGRFHMQPRWIDRLAWWQTDHPDGYTVLMVFDKPGVIEFRDWRTDGQLVSSKHEELKDQMGEEALEALWVLADRYRPLRFDKRGRAHLGNPALAHLGFLIGRGAKHNLYVVVFPDRLLLFSPTYRDSKLMEGSPLLDDLP